MDLLTAVSHQNIEALVDLVAKGANVNERDAHRRTPLMRAAEWNRAGSTRALLDAGARINDRDERGETALHTAAGSGHVEVARVLLEHGADISIRDDNRCIALTTALSAPLGFKENSLEVAKLIAQRMDPQALREILQKRLTDQRTTLDRERSSTNRLVNDITERFKQQGAAGLLREERERLRKFGESALELEQKAEALTETGRVLSEQLIDNPQEALNGIFLFAQDVSSFTIRATFVRLDSVSALPGDD